MRDTTAVIVADFQRLRQYSFSAARGVLFVLLFLAVSGWIVRREPPPLTWETLIVLALGLALGVLLYMLYALHFRGVRIELSPTGLRMRDAPSVPWTDIDDVRTIELFGVPFFTLRVRGKWGREVFPLWLDDLPLLRRKLEEYAGRDHVIAEFFRRVT